VFSLRERSITPDTPVTLLAFVVITAIVHQLAEAVVVWVQGRQRIGEIRATAQAEQGKIDVTAAAEIAKMRAASEVRIVEIQATAQAEFDRIHAAAEADLARIRATSEAKITRDVRSPRAPVGPGARPAQASPPALRTGPKSAL
jgi:hypothetical protein